MDLVSLDCLRTGASSEFAVTCCKKNWHFLGRTESRGNNVAHNSHSSASSDGPVQGQSDTFAAQRCLQVTAIRYTDFSIAWHGKRGGNGPLYPIQEDESPVDCDFVLIGHYRYLGATSS